MKCAPPVGKEWTLHQPSNLYYTHLTVEKFTFLLLFVATKNLQKREK